MTPDQLHAIVSALLGGTAWHFILRIAPWAKANGGVLRGVRDYFWTANWQKPPKI